MPQSAEISDADMNLLLDRSDLEGKPGARAMPAAGVGYEVVEDQSSHGLLSNVS